MTNTNFSTIVEQTANRMFKTTSNDSEHYILYNDGNANDLPLTENPFYFKHSKNLGQNKFVAGFGEGEWSKSECDKHLISAEKELMLCKKERLLRIVKSGKYKKK